MIRSSLARHWSELGSKGVLEPSGACLSSFVEGTFRTFGDPVLTSREQDVARLILRGHSSDSIALRLGITTATVKIHRRNLYAKLNISSQPELFALFIDVLSSASPVETAGEG